MTYKDLLKSPQWNKKRLEILKRDNYTCTTCGNKNIEIHIHHTFYELNRLPWEYPNETFLSLCKHCHDEYHKDEKRIIPAIINNFKKSGLPLDQIFDLSMSFSKLNIDPLGEPDDFEIFIVLAIRHLLHDRRAGNDVIEAYKKLPAEQKQFYLLVDRIS